MSSDESSDLHFYIHQLKCIVLFVYYTFLSFLRKITPASLWPSKDVRGQVVLITGSGRGLGRLMALKFGELGCQIVLWSRTQGPNEEVYDELRGRGVKAHMYTVDVTDKLAVKEAADQVKTDVGPVDIVINNAGVCLPYCTATMSGADFDKVIAANLLAAHYVTSQFLAAMVERDRGHVVALGTASAIMAVPFQQAYAASKCGLCGYMRGLFAELQHLGSGVKVTIAAPYIAATEMTKQFRTSTIPSLLPDLDPDYVVERIVDAVLKEDTELYLGRAWYMINALHAVSPLKAHYQLTKGCGLHSVMANFVMSPIIRKTSSAIQSKTTCN